MVVCIAKDEAECRTLALEMIGRAGRSTLTDNVALMEWEVIGTKAAYSQPELVAGHWAR